MKYVMETDKKKTARATSVNTPISPRDALEIVRTIKGMKLNHAKDYLEEVINKKSAVPYRKFLDSVSHKRGTGPGRYPVRAAKYVLEALTNAENNAEFKQLDSDKLTVRSAVAQPAPPIKFYTYKAFGSSGKFYRERVHIQIILEEIEAEESE
ncbi:MAG: 50S ribosomal protein L22 [Candidatus Thermoplasmatota archaeon]|jgi:large subunit ribosomal protein L22|nr:50S ribosomal protein L22 [Candidatus Thermoplasmatota archaeon]MCL5790241.1 50S ribosomal protein L22 [Candidatus Thermoplasmatota archaeon]